MGILVIVQRAGDVIPQVVSVMTERRDGTEQPFTMPDHCPVCGALVERLPDEVMVYCTNISCPAQLRERIKHYVSRDAMDIEGLGERNVDRFADLGFLHDVADIYALEREKLIALERLGEKSVDNLLVAIDESKNRPFARLVFALGIRHVGERSAGLLAAHFRTMDALAAAAPEEIAQVNGVGTIMARSIADFFAEAQNRALIEKLRAAGVRMADDAQVAARRPATARGPDIRAHRAAGKHEPPAGRGAPAGPRRDNHRHRDEKDERRDRWRGAGVKSGAGTDAQSPGARRSGPARIVPAIMSRGTMSDSASNRWSGVIGVQ